jgi:hypothetical protein
MRTRSSVLGIAVTLAITFVALSSCPSGLPSFGEPDMTLWQDQ